MIATVITNGIAMAASMRVVGRASRATVMAGRANCSDSRDRSKCPRQGPAELHDEGVIETVQGVQLLAHGLRGVLGQGQVGWRPGQSGQERRLDVRRTARDSVLCRERFQMKRDIGHLA